MKRLITVMLGLTLITGVAVTALAQDAPTQDGKKKKNNKKKKKQPQPKKDRSDPNYQFLGLLTEGRADLSSALLISIPTGFTSAPPPANLRAGLSLLLC